MPIKSSTDEAVQLNEALAQLFAASKQALDPSCHPRFPKYIAVVQQADRRSEEDSSSTVAMVQQVDGCSEVDNCSEPFPNWAELLDRVAQWDVDRIKAGDAQGEELIWPAKRRTAARGCAALYRIDGFVWQLSDRTGLGAEYVLGRIGVVDIILENTRTKLNIVDITLSDLARFLEPNSGNLESMLKFLQNVNNGEVISRRRLNSVAERLNVYSGKFFFDVPRLYSRHALRKLKRILGNEYEQHRERLAAYKPELVRLTGASELNQLEAILQLKRPRKQLERRTIPTSLDQTRAIERLIGVITSEDRLNPNAIPKICECLRDLANVGISVWYGEYSTGEALIPEDPSHGSRWTRRRIVAFSELGLKPVVEVDLSHTSGLGPDIDDEEI